MDTGCIKLLDSKITTDVGGKRKESLSTKDSSHLSSSSNIIRLQYDLILKNQEKKSLAPQSFVKLKRHADFENVRPISKNSSKIYDGFLSLAADGCDSNLFNKNVSVGFFLKNLIKRYQKQILFLFDCIKVAMFVSLFLFIHTKVNAQTLEEQRLLSVSPWNFLNDFTVDTNAQDVSVVDHSSGLTYTSGLRYSLGAKENLWVFGRGSKRFTGEERFDLLDTIVRYERVLDQRFLSMSTRARLDAILPTNVFIQEQTSFLGALGSQLRFTKALPYRLFLIWNNNIRWNFHKYRVSELAVPNIQTSVSTLGILSFAATPRIQTSVGLGWSVARSYENTLTDFYSIDLNASYVFTKEWSALVGWTTAGSPFTADGQNSNIRLFDERDTTFYFSVTHFM